MPREGSGQVTKAEAKRYVCRAMAVTLENDLRGVGAGWIFAADGVSEGVRPEPELRLIVGACEDLIVELSRRGRARPVGFGTKGGRRG